MNISDRQFGDFAERVRESGGFTVSTQKGVEPQSGFSVGVSGHEETHSLQSLSGEDVKNYAERKEGALSQHPQRHLGGWESKGEAYLDVSKVHSDTPVGRVKGRIAMMRNNQIAGYDIGREYETSNPYHPENRQGDIVAGDDPEQRRNWAAMGAQPSHLALTAPEKRGAKVNPAQFGSGSAGTSVT